MKNFFHPTKLPFLILGASTLGLLLRLWLQFTGFDAKGFLVSGHPARSLLWLLTALTLGTLLYATWNLKNGNKYRSNFPASPVGGMGTALGASGIGLTCGIELIAGTQGIDTLCAIMGIVAALILIFVAYCRWKGLHPTPMAHIVVSLFFMLRLICFYRHWSADPRLLDYVFQLLALVFVMLATYQRAVFDANYGSRRAFAFYCLAAVYCCCLSLVSWQDVLLFLSLAVWMLTDLCRLTPMESRPEPREEA